MNTRNQWLAVIILGGFWAGLVLWNTVFTPDPAHVPLKYVTGQTSSREAGRVAVPKGLKIRMDLLEAERQQAVMAFAKPKNIFAPLRQEESDEQKAAKARHAPPVQVPPPVVIPLPPPGPTPEELAAQAAQQELAQFRYLGFLDRDGKAEAFLSRDKEIHIVRTGATIGDRVRVKVITPKDVTLQEMRTQIEKSVAAEGK